MKWQRYCPQCGFAASRLDRTCPRCGCDLTELQEPSETESSTDSKKKAKADSADATQQPAPEPEGATRAWLPAALATALIILLAEAAGLYIIWTSGARTSASLVDGVEPGAVSEGLRQAKGVTQHGGSPSMSLPDASGIGELFEARPSPQVTPTIEMYNRTAATSIHVQFNGPRDYNGIIRPGTKLRFQLPRGTYAVRMWAHGVEPRSGRAVFKRHTHYTSQWQIVSGVPGYSAPLRMGDLSD